ncbi:hypothetical protein CBOM_05178 [Ceraceosorus bombacis]|uniref:Uncharacterized protein n=1 Tax=Ceraceosorus bombacis TaxID=401625 RepID=A0A0P1BI50_9BASI|nr:hypothetical protein CBOM_05178 [Ceraceosorus bombacis]
MHRGHHDCSIQVKDKDNKKDELMEEDEMVPNTEESERSPWLEMLQGRRGTVKYVGTTHAIDEVSAPLARDAADAKLTGTVRRARWSPGKWRVYALVDGYPGRPEAASRDPNIEELVREHHAIVAEHETVQMAPAALERSIDMASCAACSRPDCPSMMIYKDVTVEDLANEADDFGLFGWGCGQGPERIQRNLAMVDFHEEAWPYDGVTRASDPPAYASRFVIDFWPHGQRHERVLLHLIAALRMIIAESRNWAALATSQTFPDCLVQTGARIVCLVSSEVTCFLLRHFKDTLQHLKGILGPQGLADVLLGRMSLQAFAEAVSETSKYSYKLLSDAKHAGFSITQEAGHVYDLTIEVLNGSIPLLQHTLLILSSVHKGVIKYWPLLCKHYSRLSYIDTAIFCLAEHHGRPAKLLLEQVTPNISKMLIEMKRAIHLLLKIKLLYYASTTQPSLALPSTLQGNDHRPAQALQVNRALLAQILRNTNCPTAQALQGNSKRPLPTTSNDAPSSKRPLPTDSNDAPSSKHRARRAHQSADEEDTVRRVSRHHRLDPHTSWAYESHLWIAGSWIEHVPLGEKASSRSTKAGKPHAPGSSAVPDNARASPAHDENECVSSTAATSIRRTRASRAANEEDECVSSTGTVARAATTKQSTASRSTSTNRNSARALNWPFAHRQQSLFLGAPGSVERAQQFDNDLFMPFPKGKTMEEGRQWFLEQVEGHQIGPSIGGANSSDITFQARDSFDQRAYRLAKAAAAAGGEAKLRDAPWEDTSASMKGHQSAAQKTTSWSLAIEHRDLVTELDKLDAAGSLNNGLPTATVHQLADQHRLHPLSRPQGGNIAQQPKIAAVHQLADHHKLQAASASPQEQRLKEPCPLTQLRLCPEFHPLSQPQGAQPQKAVIAQQPKILHLVR